MITERMKQNKIANEMSKGVEGKKGKKKMTAK